MLMCHLQQVCIIHVHVHVIILVDLVTLHAERMKSLLKVKFSEKGSNVQAKEEQTYVLFVDFKDECKSMQTY